MTSSVSVHRGRVLLAVGLVAAVGLAVAGFVVGSRVRSPDDAVADADAPVASRVGVPVEHRVLSSTVIGRGDVRPARSVEVGAPSSVEGQQVVTGMFVAAGDRVTEGTPLVEVSGRPVFVLRGKVPVYRDMHPGMSGDDVGQLRRALGRLGCNTEEDQPGVYGAATKRCVATLYEDAGYQPLRTSGDEAAELAAARQALEEARAAVGGAESALQQAHEGPSESERLSAEAAVHGAERGASDSQAQAEQMVREAEHAVTLAQRAYDRLRADSEAEPAEVDLARVEVENAQAAVEDQRRAAEDLVAAADEQLDIAQTSYEELTAPPDVSQQQQALAQATDQRDAALAALDELRAATGPIVPFGEVVYVSHLPARVQTVTRARRVAHRKVVAKAPATEVVTTPVAVPRPVGRAGRPVPRVGSWCGCPRAGCGWSRRSPSRTWGWCTRAWRWNC